MPSRRAIPFLLIFIPIALAQPPEIHRLTLADCDDVAFGPSGDLFFACHSPTDRLPIPVRGDTGKPTAMAGYVLRLNPKSGQLIYATRFAGPEYDVALRVKVDRHNFAYTTGVVRNNGATDAFFAKLNPAGGIVHKTTIGGAANDLGTAIEIDQSGAIYIGGVTASPDFPGRQQPIHPGDDAFVCRIPKALGPPTCRVFGGRATEKLTGLALDGRGGIWAAGYTESPDFPAIQPLQPSLRGKSDAFLTRLNLNTLQLTSSTLLGGTGDDSAWSLTISNEGHPILAGITDSNDLPGTTGAYQPSSKGKRDAFITTIRDRKITTTYFGGTADDETGYDGASVKVAPNGSIWLAGITYSSDLPTRNPTQAQPGGGNGDGFIAAFSPQLDRLCFSTYFGGAGRDLLEGIAISPSGAIAATGVSFSESPTPSRVQVGNQSLYAGHHVVILPPSGQRPACPVAASK